MPFGRAKKTRAPLDEAGLMEYAVKSLASKMRTVNELRRLMLRRAEPGAAGEAAIAAVIARLQELNYLNDKRFAADYSRLRKENERFGQRRVRADLAAKGLRGEVAEKALTAAFADEDETALVRAHIDRKRMKEPKDDKERARVMGRLLRAGFSSSAIYKVMRSWGGASEEQLASLDDAAAEMDAPSEES